MKIQNYTKVNNEILRDIIRFVRPSGISNFDISFKNSKEHYFRGMAYTEGTAYHGSMVPLVIVSTSPKPVFPIKGGYQNKGGYLPQPDIYSRIEALVYITAHELRHLWQKKHPRGWRVWGARGQFSERDADAYAIRKLREWRSK